MKMTVNSMKCFSWSRLAIFTAAMAVLSSCGGGQSGMKLGDDEFTVLETPGHTPGSVTYLKNNELYCGDTLFQGSMGRTDLYGGNDEQMTASLARLGSLQGYYKVFPGHGSATNLEDEKLANPFLKQAIARLSR